MTLTTIGETKYGKNTTDCSARRRNFARSSLSMIASTMPATSDAARNSELSTMVLTTSLVAVPDIMNSRKLSNPFQGLPKMPLEMLKSLNATTRPAIGR